MLQKRKDESWLNYLQDLGHIPVGPALRGKKQEEFWINQAINRSGIGSWMRNNIPGWNYLSWLPGVKASNAIWPKGEWAGKGTYYGSPALDSSVTWNRHRQDKRKWANYGPGLGWGWMWDDEYRYMGPQNAMGLGHPDDVGRKYEWHDRWYGKMNKQTSGWKRAYWNSNWSDRALAKVAARDFWKDPIRNFPDAIGWAGMRIKNRLNELTSLRRYTKDDFLKGRSHPTGKRTLMGWMLRGSPWGGRYHPKFFSTNPQPRGTLPHYFRRSPEDRVFMAYRYGRRSRGRMPFRRRAYGGIRRFRSRRY